MGLTSSAIEINAIGKPMTTTVANRGDIWYITKVTTVIAKIDETTSATKRTAAPTLSESSIIPVTTSPAGLSCLAARPAREMRWATVRAGPKQPLRNAAISPIWLKPSPSDITRIRPTKSASHPQVGPERPKSIAESIELPMTAGSNAPITVPTDRAMVWTMIGPRQAFITARRKPFCVVP